MKHIVLIDDDLFIRDLVATKLTSDYIVSAEPNAAAGLETIADKGADLVLLDLDLADRPGLEVLRELKANVETESIPVVIFSNNDSASMREQSAKAGAINFIVKVSVDMTELKNLVDQLLT